MDLLAPSVTLCTIRSHARLRRRAWSPNELANLVSICTFTRICKAMLNGHRTEQSRVALSKMVLQRGLILLVCNVIGMD